MDELDWLLLQALALSPRSPNAALARVLEVSEQTIARRYRRLMAQGLRIRGVSDISRRGLEPWTIRLHPTPSAAHELAAALATRHDTAWVYLASGGTEIIVNALLPADSAADDLLAKLPRTSQVRQFTAHLLLDSPLQPGAATLRKMSPHQLTDHQREALTPSAQQPDPRADLNADDRQLLDTLAGDGRLSITELSARTGAPESTTRNRLDRLHHRAAIRYVVDAPSALLGRPVEARVWLAVHPASLQQAATELAHHPATTFVALTTGPTNLVTTVACESVRDLAHFTTLGLGGIPGIRTVETAPIHRTLKRLEMAPATH